MFEEIGVLRGDSSYCYGLEAVPSSSHFVDKLTGPFPDGPFVIFIALDLTIQDIKKTWRSMRIHPFCDHINRPRVGRDTNMADAFKNLIIAAVGLCRNYRLIVLYGKRLIL